MGEPLRVVARMSRAQAQARVLALFEEVGLPDPEAKAAQYPHQLSGGQRQRVLIALALARDQAILIADETDNRARCQVALRVIALLVELTRKRGMGLVFISHDLSAIARATERVAVMYGGEHRRNPDRPTTFSTTRATPIRLGWSARGPRLDRLRQRAPTPPPIKTAHADDTGAWFPPSADLLPAGCKSRGTPNKRFAGPCKPRNAGLPPASAGPAGKWMRPVPSAAICRPKRCRDPS